jgi:hypothetical protein
MNIIAMSQSDTFLNAVIEALKRAAAYNKD